MHMNHNILNLSCSIVPGSWQIFMMKDPHRYRRTLLFENITIFIIFWIQRDINQYVCFYLWASRLEHGLEDAIIDEI